MHDFHISIYVELFLCRDIFKICQLQICSMKEKNKLRRMATTLTYQYTWKIKFNPFPHVDAFWRICSRRLLKTLWQKEKLLKWAISPFALMFSTFFINYIPTFRDNFHIFAWMFSKSSAACEKGLNKIKYFITYLKNSL